ncbi:aminotransferase class I/II-fold pyridoxal phosphate-dependent enzyme [Bizionia argentinensis JUB59]|uniref:Aminotransferase n=1 Tax=Bizionia argentinensis JUB59 TaxID=1046627 RepID=G2EDK1_9FLAO|nr:aminotransferase class I/II-fold pyridoxal phosphate-dependent enzyme [Bizionia argentinensis]EGV43467.1 aminotransferase class I/II-fold pyridoxal phosphate-dependent enzyme [Bizionia argentinensis JUB59]
MIELANRLQTVEEYYFSKKLREVALLMSNGKPIINLGIGSPDLNPPQKVIEALTESFAHPKSNQYQSYQGLPEFREAIVAFYRDQYGVFMSPSTEVLPLTGSKEGIMHISMAFLNPGDQALIPNPGYPTYTSVTKLVGAEPIFYDLTEASNWLIDFEALEEQDLSKVKIMWVNYPHMPTGTNGNDAFFTKLIAFAKRYNILIINDNPYSFVLNRDPKSMLQIPGAKDVCLELNSLSKTFNMSGWRVGMVLGKSEYINAILKVKSNMDSGMLFGIQKAAIQAMSCSKLWYESLNQTYEERRKRIWELADALNCTYDKNTSGMFVWAKLPPFVKSEEFIDLLLKENNIFIAPGTIFGSNGEGYVRFSLCATTEIIEEAIARVQ